MYAYEVEGLKSYWDARCRGRNLITPHSDWRARMDAWLRAGVEVEVVEDRMRKALGFIARPDSPEDARWSYLVTCIQNYMGTNYPRGVVSEEETFHPWFLRALGARSSGGTPVRTLGENLLKAAGFRRPFAHLTISWAVTLLEPLDATWCPSVPLTDESRWHSGNLTFQQAALVAEDLKLVEAVPSPGLSVEMGMREQLEVAFRRARDEAWRKSGLSSFSGLTCEPLYCLNITRYPVRMDRMRQVDALLGGARAF